MPVDSWMYLIDVMWLAPVIVYKISWNMNVFAPRTLRVPRFRRNTVSSIASGRLVARKAALRTGASEAGGV